jgi:hypothetical protein
MEARQERLEESVARLHAAVAESNAKMVGTMKAIRESITGSRDSALQVCVCFLFFVCVLLFFLFCFVFVLLTCL